MFYIVQVMYMYYLLGFRLFGEGAEYIKEYLISQSNGLTPSENSIKNRKVPTWLERAKLKQNKREHFGKSSIFETMEESLVQTVRALSLHISRVEILLFECTLFIRISFQTTDRHHCLFAVGENY